MSDEKVTRFGPYVPKRGPQHPRIGERSPAEPDTRDPHSNQPQQQVLPPVTRQPFVQPPYTPRLITPVKDIPPPEPAPPAPAPEPAPVVQTARPVWKPLQRISGGGRDAPRSVQSQNQAPAAARPVPDPSEAIEFAKLDGVTHINMYSKGKTELGRLLAHFAYSPFTHPYYGPFNSMEGFWYYVKAEPDDKLRVLHGDQAKKYGKELPQIRREDFKELIIDANFHKISQNPKLRRLFVDSTLPFDHYYLFGPGPILVRPRGFDWLVEGFEWLREMMKKGDTLQS